MDLDCGDDAAICRLAGDLKGGAKAPHFMKGPG